MHIPRPKPLRAHDRAPLPPPKPIEAVFWQIAEDIIHQTARLTEDGIWYGECGDLRWCYAPSRSVTAHHVIPALLAIYDTSGAHIYYGPATPINRIYQS